MSAVKSPPFAPPFEGSQNDLLIWMEDNHRRLGNIYRATAYGSSVYVVSELQYVEHILRKNYQNYKKGSAIKRIAFLLGNGLMVSEGELWKRQRRMIQPAFDDKAMVRLTDGITQANIALLRCWERAAQYGVSVNVTRDVGLLILEIVLRAIFGDDYQRVAPHFSILAEERERNLQFAHAFRSLSGLITQIASHRRNNYCGSADMLGILVHARDRDSGQGMSDRQLVNEIMTLVVAGHETTASTLNWVWYLLSQNPEVEARFNTEVTGGSSTYSRQIIEEAMRLYPAGWLMTRRARKADHFGDYLVPAGTEVYVSPYIIQRRYDLWPEPARFDPDRFDPRRSAGRHPSALLPFSAGPRNCIGDGLARLAMQIHLTTIAGKLRLRYFDSEPLKLDLGVNLRTKNDLIMLPTKILGPVIN